MEVAEVALHCIKKDDALFAPFKKSGLICPVLDSPVKDLAHEHGHGILEHIFPDARQRMSRNDITGSVKT